MRGDRSGLFFRAPALMDQLGLLACVCACVCVCVCARACARVCVYTQADKIATLEIRVNGHDAGYKQQESAIMQLQARLFLSARWLWLTPARASTRCGCAMRDGA